MEAGVELILTAGIDTASSVRAIEVASKYEVVKGCIGIHPWYADEYNFENLRKLKQLAENEEVIAISEIGLDYIARRTRQWERSDKVIDLNTQRKAFRGQIGLAKELDLPMLVHDRAHGEELLDIIEDENVANMGVAIHGFSKDAEFAERAVNMGVYLSIGRSLLMGENKELEEAIIQTPIEWLLTETDSGVPTGVIEVSEKIAELKGITKEEVGIAATKNLKKLLRI
jgi:TatD DNase family protein